MSIPGNNRIIAISVTRRVAALLDDAVADYDEALKLNPKQAGSLYGRGLAKLKKGDAGGGEADIAAAKAIQADIAEEFARYGVTPSAATAR